MMINKQKTKTAESYDRQAREVNSKIDKINSSGISLSQEKWHGFVEYFKNREDEYGEKLGSRAISHILREDEEFYDAIEKYTARNQAPTARIDMKLYKKNQVFNEDLNNKNIDQNNDVDNFKEQSKNELKKFKDDQSKKITIEKIDPNTINSNIDKNINKTENIIKDQNMKIKRNAQNIKNKVEDEDSSLIKRGLNWINIGKENPNKGKKYDE